jgi:3-methyladenine DNA glycosylase AlkD
VSARKRQARRKTSAHDVDAVVAELKRQGDPRVRDGMARFAIPSDNAFGIPVGALRQYAKRLGRDHALALGLWKSGWYEARMLAAMVDEPERVTSAQMDAWCRAFDNWGICGTVCFHLFDRVPHAWRKLEPWSKKRAEFEKRGAFALLWALALHDKTSGDAPFLKSLRLIEREATDDRNFVKKAVNMSLRAIGGRNRKLHAAAVGVARRIAASTVPAARWVGKDALREFASPVMKRRLATR